VLLVSNTAHRKPFQGDSIFDRRLTSAPMINHWQSIKWFPRILISTTRATHVLVTCGQHSVG